MFTKMDALLSPKLKELHKCQVVSYLRTLDLRVGLLMNFNCPLFKDGLKRIVR
jgi:GxxExxY protein